MPVFTDGCKLEVRIFGDIFTDGMVMFAELTPAQDVLF